jgi:hypothetical protein
VDTSVPRPAVPSDIEGTHSGYSEGRGDFRAEGLSSFAKWGSGPQPHSGRVSTTREPLPRPTVPRRVGCKSSTASVHNCRGELPQTSRCLHSGHSSPHWPRRRNELVGKAPGGREAETRSLGGSLSAPRERGGFKQPKPPAFRVLSYYALLPRLFLRTLRFCFLPGGPPEPPLSV